jgi:glutathione S-transferase
MAKPVLVIGNKCYSSWSLRGWLPLRHHGIEFEERRLALETEEFAREIGKYAPTRRVPVLVDGEVTVWDSLAVAEYVNERWLDGKGWPTDRAARAHARTICAEMHSGFAGLRRALPMDCRASGAPTPVDAAARADVARMRELIAGCRSRFGARSEAGGPWLFGEFSLADCYFAPIVVRFKGYGVPVDGAVAAWVGSMWALPALVEWVAAGRAEREVVPSDVLRLP